LLVGQSVDDLGYAARRRGVDDGADYRRSDHGSCGDCRCNCDGVIAAAATVVSATVIVVIDVHVDVAIHVDVVIAVHIGVVVPVDVCVPVLVLVHVPAWGVDAGSSAAAGATTASTPAATTAASALRRESESRYRDGDDEDGEDLS